MSASSALFLLSCNGRILDALLFHRQLRHVLHANALMPLIFLYKLLIAYSLERICS